MYSFLSNVEVGGLISYGVNVTENYRRAAVFVDKVLKGVKPADLPIEQRTKFELAVNLKTAKALGLTISRSILLRADRVVQQSTSTTPVKITRTSDFTLQRTEGPGRSPPGRWRGALSERERARADHSIS